jgi:MFS superfamily sulfate permease-like transporter
MKNYFRNYFAKDFMSSLVVFLVALPLCMGIAIASGVDPIIGLLSGIIGGLIVGTFAGCPLQVSGPAAGLAVMVFQYVEQFGVAALVPLGIIVGAFQIMMDRFKLAQYFRAISPALIKGMLAGIGLLILISQLHIAIGSKPGGNGLNNILSLPERFLANLVQTDIGMMSGITTLMTLLCIVFWQKFFPKISKKLPAPLFAIVVVSAIASIMSFPIAFVSIPANLFDEINFINANSFDGFSMYMLISALALAFVASAESLLCVNAVDRLTNTKSDYNREIMAQGLGNMVAGLVGALPLTGVIVRSSANIESGGKTRGAAIMHGFWLLLLVFLLPQILEFVPIAALAGILIFTGIKLLDLPALPKLILEDRKDGLVFLLTVGLITAADLLTGVIAGFVVSLVMLGLDIIKLDVETQNNEDESKLKLQGKATFLHIPKITKELDRVVQVKSKRYVVDMSGIQYLDKVIEAEVSNWEQELKQKEIQAHILMPQYKQNMQNEAKHTA